MNFDPKRKNKPKIFVGFFVCVCGSNSDLKPFSSSLSEMEKWMEDIKMGIEMAKSSNGPSSGLLTSNLTDSSKLSQKKEKTPETIISKSMNSE